MNDFESKLDELDVKFFEEFALLMDVFTSSLNRLSNNFSDYFSLINDRVDEFTLTHTQWSKKLLYKNSFKPFRSNDRIKILNSLESVFINESVIILEKKFDDESKINSWLAFGFWFDVKFEPFPFAYFGVYNYDIENGKTVLPIDFYTSLKLNEYTPVIYHPFNGDSEESIEIQIKKISQEEIEKGFQIFKDNILESYLQNIK